MQKLEKYLSLCLIVVALFSFTASADGEVYDPQADPLVSLSYVNEVLKPAILQEAKESLRAELEQSILASVSEQLKNSMETQTVPTDPPAVTYEIVHLTKGDVFWARGSCEVLMTAGSASVRITDPVNLENGIGLNDLTGSCRLLNGQAVPCDHYLIIPRADGRGFVVTSGDAYIMVRGDYSVEQEQ